MAFIPTPRADVYSKSLAGTSDVSISNGVYKFLGCSILNVSASVGFNGTASSLNVTLVEDTQNGDLFISPDMPSAWGFSLPYGGVGAPIFYTTFDFNPNGTEPTNTPFYFAGVCVGWQKTERDISGRLIDVSLADPRELLRGVQCLLGGFALSQNVLGSLPRYSQVENIIDVFGYFDYGMTADVNEYGMAWADIKTAIENVQVAVNGIKFEFYFTGECFTSTPDWYRIDGEVIDIVSLAEQVARDGGSDLICIGRKVASDAILVEFKGIRRTNGDPLTQSEIYSFVNARTSIVDNFKIGQEYRNEPTSSVVVGGMRNKNYTAYPSTYAENMHLRLHDCGDGAPFLQEDYNAFPADIKLRLFGGSGTVYQEPCDGSGLNPVIETFNVSAGGIFPFWGFSPSGTQYPLIEPFLSLDHLVFDRDDEIAAQLKQRIPRCKLGVTSYTVREVAHEQTFLDGDEDSDDRPFAYIESVLGSGIDVAGYIRGLPLNTEVLRAALCDERTFFNLYTIHYPQYAKDMGFPYPHFKHLMNYVFRNPAENITLENVLQTVFNYDYSTLSQDEMNALPRGANGQINDADAIILAAGAGYRDAILRKFGTVIYDHVRRYAEENMGIKFLVCLPKSTIMNRIWSGLPVPTRTDFPEIEYVVSDRGYWETLPFELDGLVDPSGTTPFTADEENQIIRRFMAEDGRFYAMVGIDWQPSGNCSFNSNTLNKAMFQDLPVSDFRPNKIASSTPSYVLCACSVNQLQKRPDLALVELPGPIYFDPQRNANFHHGFIYTDGDYADDKIYTKLGIMKMLWYFFKRDQDFRSAILQVALAQGLDLPFQASKVISAWADILRSNFNESLKMDLNIERVMDLKGVIVPLTSNWVPYGPWYATSGVSLGMVDIKRDDSLVPWNFDRSPLGWDYNLNIAGNEALDRTIANTDYIDNAYISAAGFPELGLSSELGYNSNLTSISVDFGIGGIKTTYSFSTYLRKPGTFRKSEYDNISRARRETRSDIIEPENISISDELYGGPSNQIRNRFRH